MLSRLILLAVQLAVAWYAADEIVRYLPRFGPFSLFVYAAVYAVLVWLVGLVLSQVLKETGTPSSATLVTCLIVALIGAALAIWLPEFFPPVRPTMRQLSEYAYPLIGAVIGYHLKR